MEVAVRRTVQRPYRYVATRMPAIGQSQTGERDYPDQKRKTMLHGSLRCRNPLKSWLPGERLIRRFALWILTSSRARPSGVVATSDISLEK